MPAPAPRRSPIRLRQSGTGGANGSETAEPNTARNTQRNRMRRRHILSGRPATATDADNPQFGLFGIHVSYRVLACNALFLDVMTSAFSTMLSIVSSMNAVNSARNRSGGKAGFALRPTIIRQKRIFLVDEGAHASRNVLGGGGGRGRTCRCVVTKDAVTVSRTPPSKCQHRSSFGHGLDGIIPKSSSAANMNARAVAIGRTRNRPDINPTRDTLGPAKSRSRLGLRRPSPATIGFRSGIRPNALTIASMFLSGTRPACSEKVVTSRDGRRPR